jgi:DNA-binding CsgD family transcriptional regulator/catechol 2,3-dioxygenase-like lactoylglutathione lyase family enzyme
MPLQYRKPGRRRGRPPHDDVLTPAEWAVVHAVRHGLSDARIALRRGVSRDAVRFHVRNVLAKLGLRGRAELRRWTGVPRTSGAYARARNQEKRMTTTRALGLGPIGQISRTVRDIDEACAWYGNVLGLAHLYTFGKLAFFDLGGTRLYLSAESEPQPESILYLRVDDIGAAYAELSSRGVEFKGAPHLIHRHADGTEEWMAFFKDPEGRFLALMSQVPPQRE